MGARSSPGARPSYTHTRARARAHTHTCAHTHVPLQALAAIFLAFLNEGDEVVVFEP